MTTFSEFAAARLDEADRAAMALCDGDWGTRAWDVTACKSGCPCIVYQGEYKPFSEPQEPLIRYICDAETPQLARHIAAWSPAAALWAVQMKRELLAEHAPDCPVEGPASCRRCITDRGRWQEDWSGDLYPCRTLRLVFADWSHHPDYDPAWAPCEVAPWT